MTKQEYLSVLKRKLQPIEPQMIDAIIKQYDDIFESGYQEDKKDDAIISELGTTDFVADYYKSTLNVQHVQQEESKTYEPGPNVDRPVGVSVLRGLFVGFGLLMFNLVIVLAPYITGWALIVSFFTLGVALSFSGIVVAIATIVTLPFGFTVPTIMISHPVLLFAFCAMLISLGLVFVFINVFLLKHYVVWSFQYLKWNVAMIRGDKNV